MPEQKSMTLLAACRDFFGLKPAQTGMGFGKEYKQLTESDREEIKRGLQQNGYEIISAPGAAAS